MPESRTVRLYDLTCQRGHEYEGPELGDFAYGEFLVWSANGSASFVDSNLDPVWDEVLGLAADVYPAFDSLGDSPQRQLAQAAYSATLDPASDGPLAIGPAPCPTCGSKPVRFHPSDPERWREVPLATQAGWSTYDIEDKRQRIQAVAKRWAGG